MVARRRCGRETSSRVLVIANWVSPRPDCCVGSHAAVRRNARSGVGRVCGILVAGPVAFPDSVKGIARPGALQPAQNLTRHGPAYFVGQLLPIALPWQPPQRSSRQVRRLWIPRFRRLRKGCAPTSRGCPPAVLLPSQGASG